MYLRTAVNVPQVQGVFDYALPSQGGAQVQPGCLLEVPFGQQVVQAVVLKRVEIPAVAEPRAALRLVDPQPVLTEHQLRLAEAIADQTLAPLAQCIFLMVPAGLNRLADTLYELHPSPPANALPPGKSETRILDLLRRRGALRGRQLETAFPHQDWKTAVQRLARAGRLIARPVLPPPAVRPKVVRTVRLAASPQVIAKYWETLGRGSTLERRQAALRFLMAEPWEVDVAWVYASSGAKLSDLQRLAELGLVILGEDEVWRDPLETIEAPAAEPPVMTPAQQAAWEQIQAGLHSKTAPPFLLYGITGSGKTELYLRAVEETLRQGRQAIVLVPEISLTPQTVRRFLARFPGQVGLVHSRLSPGERYDTWRRARSGQLGVIVGPRSALFAPLPNPGLIILDECHDASFFQGETAPFYHSVQAALAYARELEGVVIFGSATPPVSLTYRARREHWSILKLPERVPMMKDGKPGPALALPEVQVIDMRQELKADNRSIFSRVLQQAIEKVLAERQQAILFLNRRGSASYVFCRDCGFVLRCPRCDLPLTYHTGAVKLRCHTCGYERNMPTRCPSCGSGHIRQYGMGTEKVESDLLKQFPEARVLRWDAETARGKGGHDLILTHFGNHQADILVGTQMLAKGLDLPLVTLVGIILADVGLNFPDYQAGERAFQLLTQVAGRAGRSALGGKVILQTFQPEHYAICAAAAQDYPSFYERELGERRRLGYPPFSHLARLEVRSLHADEAERNASRLAGQVKSWVAQGDHPATELIGPVPCFFARINGYYRWQVILRGPDPLGILRDRDLLGARLELDPPSIL